MKVSWPEGTRVRCNDNKGVYARKLKQGSYYVVDFLEGEWVTLRGVEGRFLSFRFKPVVRVKMGRKPDLATLLRESAAAVAAMTPEQREDMFAKQRASYARQDMD